MSRIGTVLFFLGTAVSLSATEIDYEHILSEEVQMKVMKTISELETKNTKLEQRIRELERERSELRSDLERRGALNSFLLQKLEKAEMGVTENEAIEGTEKTVLQKENKLLRQKLEKLLKIVPRSQLGIDDIVIFKEMGLLQLNE